MALIQRSRASPLSPRSSAWTQSSRNPRPRGKDCWLAKRAEILVAAGRHADARAARTQALAEIEALSPFHRQANVTQALEAELRSALARPDAETPQGESHR
jgi:hypothetical protein